MSTLSASLSKTLALAIVSAAAVSGCGTMCRACTSKKCGGSMSASKCGGCKASCGAKAKKAGCCGAK